MIREKVQFVVERTVCSCDRCGQQITAEDDRSEWQEKFAIRFRGGYGSVFGDGSSVAGDFCQSCIHQVLGKYLRVVPDDPFHPVNELQQGPQRIYQPSQDATSEEEDALCIIAAALKQHGLASDGDR
jgi:hypothetical protein